MKLMSFIVLSAMLSITACSHMGKSCCKEKQACCKDEKNCTDKTKCHKKVEAESCHKDQKKT